LLQKNFRSSFEPTNDYPQLSFYLPMDSIANTHVEPLQSITTESRTPAAAVSPSSSPVPTPSAILNPFDPHYPLPSNQEDPLCLAAPQTWAQRHPHRDTQPERLRAKTIVALGH
jgi:hypothetical protein